MYAPDLQAGEVAAMASRLLAEPCRLLASGGGGNNRIYRVQAVSGDYALKFYPLAGVEARDRLGAECAAVRFLHQHGVTLVPRWVAMDAAAGCALFQWVEGTPIRRMEDTVVAGMLDFLDQVQALEHLPDAEPIGRASDACLSPAEAGEQVQRRLAHLMAWGEGLELQAFVREGLQPAARALLQRAAALLGSLWEQPLSRGLAMLSPSDFGSHNMLQQADGQLVFLDLEYFGWDDPVKLVCDMLWHPGMALAGHQAARLREGVRQVRMTRGDDTFDQRLQALWPVFGVIWCLILLNPFLPEGWRRLGSSQPRAAVLAERLAKSRHTLARLGSWIHDGNGTLVAGAG